MIRIGLMSIKHLSLDELQMPSYTLSTLKSFHLMYRQMNLCSTIAMSLWVFSDYAPDDTALNQVQEEEHNGEIALPW